MFQLVSLAQLLLLSNSSSPNNTDNRFDIFAAVCAMPVDWVGYGYAALIATGGLIGYKKAGSNPSLAAGLLFGSLAGIGAYQISNDPHNIWVSLGTSGALAGIMGKRFYGSRKVMPAGLMAGASVLMVGKLGLNLLQNPKES